MISRCWSSTCSAAVSDADDTPVIPRSWAPVSCPVGDPQRADDAPLIPDDAVQSAVEQVGQQDRQGLVVP